MPPEENHSRRQKWLLAACITATVFLGTLWIVALRMRDRFQPYIKAQAVSWLQNRFNADVEMVSLKLHVPAMSPLRMLRTRGRGTLAGVEGFGLQLRQRNSLVTQPLLKLKHFSFRVDLGAVFDSPKVVDRVVLEGMELTIPPKGQRTPLQPVRPNDASSPGPSVIIREIVATDSILIILPRVKSGDPKVKLPLVFDISSLHLRSVGRGLPMQYEGVLTNPKPIGLVHSNGSFGPWNADEPGDTPLNGHYSFDHADLGIFSAIAGILYSTGDFDGTLSAVSAKGTASVPDFRLKSAGNPVPLRTVFEVLVDGGNGDTILKPVHATLGTTLFTTSGAVIKRDGDPRRSIALDVIMPDGNLRDVLRLAMKDTPFMEGRLALKCNIVIPPLTTKVKNKLILGGRFKISNGKFLRSEIQSKIDALSRRGQGQPNNREITEELSDMTGSFHMEGQTISFNSLTFATAGASVKLAGNYDLGKDNLDFHGSLSLRARVSETMTGWKRWVLKPADPFFAKNGAGTFLRIKIEGSSKSPDFGLDHGPDTTSPSR